MGRGLAWPRRARGWARAKPPPVCAPLTRTWDRAPRNQMAAWTSGPEMTLPVMGVMDSVMARLLPGPAAASLVREPLLLSPCIRSYVTPPRGASGGLEGEGQVVVDEADGTRALANG